MTAEDGPGQVRAGAGADVWPEWQSPASSERLALVDLLDRVLGGGVVVAGDVTLSIAGVDMVTISLRALVASVSALASSSANALEAAE
jgi:Gas vesicle protein